MSFSGHGSGVLDWVSPLQERAIDVAVWMGVSGAFLWVFIWSLRGTLKVRNLSFLGSDEMDNLLKDHSKWARACRSTGDEPRDLPLFSFISPWAEECMQGIVRQLFHPFASATGSDELQGLSSAWTYQTPRPAVSQTASSLNARANCRPTISPFCAIK